MLLAGAGRDWDDQAVPFHASTSGLPGGEGFAGSDPLPTAMQLVADAHETLYSRLPGPPGVEAMAQVEPFHRSAKVPHCPALELYDPTAMQSMADVHDTPCK